jgi:hypothetical protein
LNSSKTISLFLAFILTAGTITSFFPSSLMTEEVNAFPELMNDNYNSKYKQDNIKCTNSNLNVNGFDFEELPESLRGLVEEQTAQAGDSEISSSEFGSDNKGSHYDKDFAFICKNNNNNTFVISPTPSSPPSLQVNIVCTVWHDNTPGNFDIFFARSTDGGLTFNEPENMSENTGDSFNPEVICEGNNVYVVWQDNTPGNFDIFFAVSTDGGQTFSEPENISENTGDSFAPRISSEGNNVYVVWQDDTPGNVDIIFARSTDGGQTFSIPPDNLSENAGGSFGPQISTEGNKVYVVWWDTTIGNRDILFARSTDGGQTFSIPPDNLSENAGASAGPRISSEGNNVYVIWTDTTPGNDDIFFAVSTDGGLTFSEPENISENTGDSFAPRISSEGNNVYVIWVDDTPGNDDIFFAVSTDGGQTFSIPPDNLSENAGGSDGQQISTEGNNVYVVWVDDTPGNRDILFAVSTDGGQTFSIPPDNLSENAGMSSGLQISSTTS